MYIKVSMFLILTKLAICQLTLFIGALCCIFVFLFDMFRNAFLYNVYINSVIVISFVFGIITSFIKIFSYEIEYKKLTKYDSLSKKTLRSLKLLSSLPIYMKQTNSVLSQAKLQIILSDVDNKVSQSEAVPKYIAGTLIFLGLFGTFWGLSQTIGNVSQIIDNLGLENDATSSFLKLKNSLKIPLQGMGIAFGCSLFGLCGSLILGFLNLLQRRIGDVFLDKVEEWLSKHTVNLDTLEQNSEYHGQLFSMGLLEKTIETIYAFQHQLNDIDSNKMTLYNMQKEIGEKISQLSVALTKHQDIIRALGENQLDIQKAVVKISSQFSENVNTNIVAKLSVIDASINQMIQNSVENRNYLANALGSDIKMVAKTLSSFRD